MFAMILIWGFAKWDRQKLFLPVSPLQKRKKDLEKDRLKLFVSWSLGFLLLPVISELPLQWEEPQPCLAIRCSEHCPPGEAFIHCQGLRRAICISQNPTQAPTDFHFWQWISDPLDPCSLCSPRLLTSWIKEPGKDGTQLVPVASSNQGRVTLKSKCHPLHSWPCRA